MLKCCVVASNRCQSRRRARSRSILGDVALIELGIGDSNLIVGRIDIAFNGSRCMARAM
jgi:hypothetical protein